MLRYVVALVGMVGTTAFGVLLERQGMSDAGLVVVMVVCAAIVVAATVYAGRAHPRSLRLEWIKESERFHELAVRDHAVVPAGTPWPGYQKVQAGWSGSRWDLGGGLTNAVLKNAEVQCRLAGSLLKHSRRSKHKGNWRTDPVQRWIQFVADNGEITNTFTSSSRDGVEEEFPQMEFFLIASERACKQCAAVEPPAPTP